VITIVANINKGLEHLGGVEQERWQTDEAGSYRTLAIETTRPILNTDLKNRQIIDCIQRFQRENAKARPNRNTIITGNE